GVTTSAAAQKSAGRSASSGAEVREISRSVMFFRRRTSARPRRGPLFARDGFPIRLALTAIAPSRRADPALDTRPSVRLSVYGTVRWSPAATPMAMIRRSLDEIRLALPRVPGESHDRIYMCVYVDASADAPSEPVRSAGRSGGLELEEGFEVAP